MRTLSKSKLLAFRQCPKRLWLEVRRSELRHDTEATQASFTAGHQVGDIAQQLYGPKRKGNLFHPKTEELAAIRGERGPVFVYNAGFETARIEELGDRFPRLKRSLLAINERVFYLRRVAEQHYYHPSQQGSWSIKKVLPAIAPELRYGDLDGVQNGGMAMNAFLEATAAGTTGTRKAQIEQQLRDYCGLDTYAMVRLWKFFSGRTDLTI